MSIAEGAHVSESVDERLRRLEERLTHLEQLLARSIETPSGVAPGPPPLISPQVHAASEMDVEPEPVAVIPYAAVAPSSPEDLTPPPIPLATAEEVHASKPYDIQASVAPPPLRLPGVGYEPSPPPLPVRPPGELERTVGLKWAGWFGAIVLVIGAGLAIKFAYDQGWLGLLPDVAKLLLMSLAGFALIAIGEVILRRINRLSSVGFYGAGVAVLFLVGYAGYAWYGVYAQRVAFALMGAATLIGILVAARADLVSIAVLSLIGGHLVPILLRSGSESAVPLLTFLLLLQTLVLALCYWQAKPKWWVLRSVSLAATALWQLALVIDLRIVPADTVPSVTIFTAVYWTLYQCELILTAVRANRRRIDAAAPAADAAGSAVFSILVTAQSTLVLLLAHADGSPTFRGGLLVVAAAVCGVLGLAVRSRATVPSETSASLLSQAAALLVLAVPVALDGANVVFGWLGLAVAFALFSLWRSLVVTAVAAAVTWCLAVGALALWASSSSTAFDPWLSIAGVAIQASVVVAAVTALVGHAIAVLLEVVIAPADPRQSTPELHVLAAHAVAGLVWVYAAVFGLPYLPATLALLVYAWVLCAASFWKPLRLLAVFALVAVVVAAVKWALVDLIRGRLDPASAVPAVFNRYLFTGVGIAATLVGVAWSRRSVLLPRRRDGDDPIGFLRSLLMLPVVAVMSVGLTVEIIAFDGPVAGGYSPVLVKLLMATMLWAAALTAVLLVDRLLLRPQETLVADLSAALLMVVTAKYILLDEIVAAIAESVSGTRVVFNLQVLAGLIVLAALAAVVRTVPHPFWKSVARTVMVLMVLVVGSVEVARYAEIQTAAPTWIVRQAGWSIWWSIYAVGLVIVGFIGRSAPLRIVGLALFALTLGKVVLVDLSSAGSGWRILSFVGLGLLLLGTSVLYGRYGGRLLAAVTDPNAPPAADPTMDQDRVIGTP